MAEADIAYVATAGAAGLALALSAWAARLRGRLARRAGIAEAELSAARAALADLPGATLTGSAAHAGRRDPPAGRAGGVERHHP